MNRIYKVDIMNLSVATFILCDSDWLQRSLLYGLKLEPRILYSPVGSLWFCHSREARKPRAGGICCGKEHWTFLGESIDSYLILLKSNWYIFHIFALTSAGLSWMLLDLDWSSLPSQGINILRLMTAFPMDAEWWVQSEDSKPASQNPGSAEPQLSWFSASTLVS